MAVLDGCEGNTKTWILEEMECPRCGEILEYYTMRGRIVQDEVCSCGYVLKAQEQIERVIRNKDE